MGEHTVMGAIASTGMEMCLWVDKGQVERRTQRGDILRLLLGSEDLVDGSGEVEVATRRVEIFDKMCGLGLSKF